MKRTKAFSVAMIALLVLLLGCRKEKSDLTGSVHNGNTVTAVGVADGSISHKTIGASGGELTSADGIVKINIPAGALSRDTLISIQPITNMLPSGVGKAYRLTPHGVQFAKPISIVFHYKEEDLENTIEEGIDIAFQDVQGSWQALLNKTLDKNNKKITITTNHFSDWTRFKSMLLRPKQAAVELGGTLELKVTTTFPFVDPDDDPSKIYLPVYTAPRELRPDEVKGWSYSGEGILISRGSNAYYTAPDHEPAANPEAVAVNINLHRKGQFMMISHITVLAGHGVDYLQVDEDYKSPLNGGKCMLYMWGKFGTDPGAGKRSVRINGETVMVNLWSPTIIRCTIDDLIWGPIEIVSNEKTIARTVLRRYSGKFVYTRYHGGVANANSADALKEVTEFELYYRGFGSPCPPTVNKLFNIEGSLSFLTEANSTLSGQASVSTPPSNGCVMTTSVSLPTTTHAEPLLPKSMSSMDGFWATSTETSYGINVKLDFNVLDVIKNVQVKRVYSCGTGAVEPRHVGLSLEGFGNTTIPLEFVGPDKLQLRGTHELKSVRLSSGILIEAWDGTGNPSHYQTDGLMWATFANK